MLWCTKSTPDVGRASINFPGDGVGCSQEEKSLDSALKCDFEDVQEKIKINAFMMEF